MGETDRAFILINESSQIMLESRSITASIPLASLSKTALYLDRIDYAKGFLKQSLFLAQETKKELQARRALDATAALMAVTGSEVEAQPLFQLASAAPHFANPV